MGNTASCQCVPSILTSSSSSSSSSSELKVFVTTTGALKIYSNRPLITPSDLLFEFPGHFVSDSASLFVGHRVVALPADEILRPCRRNHLYILLPMEMLFSVLTHDELASISHRAADAISLYGRRCNSLRKIFPVCIFPSDGRKGSRRTTADDEDGDDLGILRGTLEEKQCCSRHGSWRPALETIVEG